MALRVKDPMPYIQPLLNMGYETALIWQAEQFLNDASRNDVTIYQAFTLLLDSMKYPTYTAVKRLFRDNLTLFGPYLWNLWAEHQDLLRLQSQDLGSVLQNHIASFLGREKPL